MSAGRARSGARGDAVVAQARPDVCGWRLLRAECPDGADRKARSVQMSAGAWRLAGGVQMSAGAQQDTATR